MPVEFYYRPPGGSTVQFTELHYRPPGGSAVELTELWYRPVGGSAVQIYSMAGLAQPVLDPISVLGYTSLRLTWSAVSGATGYKVERSLTGVGGWSQVQDLAGLTWDDTSLADGTRYYYRVKAYDGGGDGPDSNIENGITSILEPVLTSAAAGGAAGAPTVNIVLTDGGSVSETEIRVYVSSTGSGSGFSLWTTLPANDTAETLVGFAAGTDYWIKLRNYNATAGESGDSAVEYVQTVVANVTDLVVSKGSACGDLDLDWTDVAGNTGYTVNYRVPPAITWTFLTSLGASANSHTDSGLGQGAEREYQVLPEFADATGTSNVDGETTASVPTATSTSTPTNPDTNAVSVAFSGGVGRDTLSVRRKYAVLGTWETLTSSYTGGSPYTDQDFSDWLDAPSSLTVSSYDDNEINLSWTNGATRGDEIVIMRNAAGAGFVELTTLSTSASSYKDDTVSPSTNYQYYVFYRGTQSDVWYYGTLASNVCGSTGWDDASTGVSVEEAGSNSNTVSQTTLALQVPTAPTAVSATEIISAIQIDWTDNADNEANFRLEVDVDGGGYSLVTSPAADAETYLDFGSYSSGEELTYRVRAENAAGNSSWAYASPITVT